MTNEHLILQKLNKIGKDVKEIKDHMVDVDTILTPEEEAVLEIGLKEYIEGKTITLEDYKKRRS